MSTRVLIPDPDIRIIHRLVCFRPMFDVRILDLQEEEYRGVLRRVLDSARDIAQERSWEPRPCLHYAFCAWASICDAVPSALDLVPF